MSKYTREELSKRIDDLELDDDIKLSLIEDIHDSMDYSESEELSTLRNDYAKKTEEYDDLYRKYKERFFESNDSKVSENEQIEINDNVIDVRNLF